MRFFLPIIAAAIGLSASVFAGEPPLTTVPDLSSPGEIFSAVNGSIESGQADGAPVLKWKINSGQTSILSMRKENPLFTNLRFYDRMDFEFRVAGGEINSIDLQALGHVSGPYQGMMHDWQISVRGAASPVWRKRQIELGRPAWYPWVNPDGDGENCLRLKCMALLPDTVVEIRGIRFARDLIRLKPDFEMPITWPVLTRNPDGSATYRTNYQVRNTANRPVTIEARILSTHAKFNVALRNADDPNGKPDSLIAIPVKNGKVASFELVASMPADAVKGTDELYEEELCISFSAEGVEGSSREWRGHLVRPLSQGLRRQAVISKTNLDKIRSELASGNAELRRMLDLDAVIKGADDFLAKKLLHIPTSHRWAGNSWDGDWRPGESMPEAVNTKTGEREFGTNLASYTWISYMAYPGNALENLGKAYLYTGDEKYAAKAVELFSLYAKQYGELHWGPGVYAMPWDRSPVTLANSRVASSSTYGSNWIFKSHCRLLSTTADSAAWTDEKRRDVYVNFVLPFATEIMKFPGGISNMTDITNHNILLLGIAFDDPLMVRWAARSDAGLLPRLADIDADGFSSEGRPLNYHFAGMAEFLPTIAYLENSGLALKYPRENLLNSLRMPYLRATLNGFVPCTGDNARGGMAGKNPLAGLFAGIFPGETWLYDAGASPLECWLAGRAPSPEDSWRKLLATGPVLFKHAGMAILRSGETPETQVMATLDFGRNVMHAALDRNQITLCAFGKVFTHGPGSLYNAGESGRNRDPKLESFIGHHSISQNVVLVDRQNQLQSVGELLSWKAAPELQKAVARVDGVAPGVSHIRALVLVRGVFVVFDRLVSGQEHCYDFAYHNFGTLAPGDGWKQSPAGAPLGTGANYENIVDLSRLEGNGMLRLEWDLSGQSQDKPAGQQQGSAPVQMKLSLWHNTLPGSEIYTGVTGLNNPNTNRIPDAAPSLFHRLKAANADFATVLEPHKGNSALREVRFPTPSSALLIWQDGTETALNMDALMAE